MWTASTVFSSPCLRRVSEALCRKVPKRCLRAVRYTCWGSCGSVSENPEWTGWMEAIISGISSLPKYRLNSSNDDRSLTRYHLLRLKLLTLLGKELLWRGSECQQTHFEQPLNNYALCELEIVGGKSRNEPAEIVPPRSIPCNVCSAPLALLGEAGYILIHYQERGDFQEPSE